MPGRLRIWRCLFRDAPAGVRVISAAMQSIAYPVDDDTSVRGVLALAPKNFSRVLANAETHIGTCRPEWRGCFLPNCLCPT
jgi:hypothetical protein